MTRQEGAWDGPLLAGVALISAAAVGVVVGLGTPTFHDEFAYLLLGETFASGRFTNPTPPFWEHLETFHVLMEPSYTAKYPPAQGLALAVGFLLGHPLIGVWISSALLVWAVTWMLQAYLPRRWAAVGGVLVLLQLGLASYWTQSYWGGSVAALGGALVYGALPRLLRRRSGSQAVAVALGLLILANSRPLEGLVASLPALAILSWSLWQDLRSRRSLVWAVPGTAVLVVGFGAMGVYNEAVTGSPFRMPYQVHAEQHQAYPNLLFLEPRSDPPTYNHPEFEQFWVEWDGARYTEMRTLRGFVRTRLLRVTNILVTLLSLSAIGLLFVPLRDRAPGVRLSLLVVIPTIGVAAMTKGMWPHYVAPVLGSLVLLAVAGLRRLARWRTPPRWPPPVLSGPSLLLVGGALLFALAVVRASVVEPRDGSWLAYQTRRAEVEACLSRLPSSHLVLVDYRGEFLHQAEWIRNAPSPFEDPIVWARSMSESEDAELMASVPERAVWRAVIEPRGAPGGPIAPLDLIRPPTTPNAADRGGGQPCR